MRADAVGVIPSGVLGLCTEMETNYTERSDLRKKRPTSNAAPVNPAMETEEKKMFARVSRNEKEMRDA